MTGAGTAEMAFAKEDSFLGSLVGTPDYFEPGRDPTVQELSLERALARQRKPGSVWSVQSVAENLEGAFGVQFTLDDGQQSHVHDIVFNGTSPVTLVPGLAATSRWYLGLDYYAGGAQATVERVAKGCAPLDYTVEYQQGGQIRISITFVYADEEYNTTIMPSSISEATGSSGQWHGMDLSIGGTTQVKEQSATLSLSNISRLQRGSEAIAVEAVTGPVEATLDLTAIFSETDQLELAYGGSGQTSTSATMDDVAGSITLSAGGAQVVDYQLAQLKPDSYAWENLINGEDTTESVTFNVDGDPAVTVA